MFHMVIVSDSVFLNKFGKFLSAETIQASVKVYAKKAKIEFDITPHTFRRSCATELIRNNANIYHVKELLGHESLDTLKPYIKLNISDLKKTHAKFHPREKD